jgi:hypothetical protein
MNALEKVGASCYNGLTMSQTDQPDYSEMQPTAAAPEHAWLKNLVGSWKTEATMMMGPEVPAVNGTGTEVCMMFGDLWVLGEGTATMSDGSSMESKNGLGFDVSFREYRTFWIATGSSHLWKGTGTLSADGKTMVIDCVGPDMFVDGKTANYRDTIQLIDENHRTLTSSSENPDGSWTEFMVTQYTRIA